MWAKCRKTSTSSERKHGNDRAMIVSECLAAASIKYGMLGYQNMHTETVVPTTPVPFIASQPVDSCNVHLLFEI